MQRAQCLAHPPLDLPPAVTLLVHFLLSIGWRAGRGHRCAAPESANPTHERGILAERRSPTMIVFLAYLAYILGLAAFNFGKK